MPATGASNASERTPGGRFFAGAQPPDCIVSARGGIKSRSERPLRRARPPTNARKELASGLEWFGKSLYTLIQHIRLSPRGSTGGSLENETLSTVPRGVCR